MFFPGFVGGESPHSSTTSSSLETGWFARRSRTASRARSLPAGGSYASWAPRTSRGPSSRNSTARTLTPFRLRAKRRKPLERYAPFRRRGGGDDRADRGVTGRQGHQSLD